ncbi:uncharacterized protein LOC131153922 [Malania oleifera]|uniref:uncharacterized protein LOC131153922 n=1 Tax=Malania oleifera TaxID=397392 RepID=UPI0025ADC52B|nr:uncharacterized protein LOC131153922 [Malania oleifera]
MSVAIVNGPTVAGFVEDSEAFDECVNQWFDALDADGDGVLSREELRRGFAGFDDILSKEEIEELYETVFERFDGDDNGVIDRDEYRSLVKEFMLAMARGIGDSPVQVALESGSLLTRAVEHEAQKNS